MGGMGSKLFGLYGLPCQLYCYMPGLFGGISTDIYNKWQKNRRISNFVSQGTGKLLRKDSSVKRDRIEIFRPTMLLKADFKNLALVLAKGWGALDVEELVGDVQTCAIANRSIHNNLHLKR